MPLSEKTRALLLAPFAVSRVLQRFGNVGIIGMGLCALGIWRDMQWAVWIGAVLAAPIAWAYAVLFFVYLPMLIFEGVRSAMKKRR